jgi:hypothetical protein
MTGSIYPVTPEQKAHCLRLSQHHISVQENGWQ